MKRIGILFLALLLVVGLVACKGMTDSRRDEDPQEQETSQAYEDLQAYEALMQEMRELSEYAFSMEVSIVREAVLSERLPQSEDGEARFYPGYIQVDGTVSMTHREMQIRYTEERFRGSPVPRPVNKLFTEDAVYMDLSAVIIENVLGETRHTRASFAELGGGSFSDLTSRLPILPPDAEAVSRRGDVLFVVTLTGSDAAELLEDILDMLTQFATVDENRPAIGDLAEVLMTLVEYGEEGHVEEPESVISAEGEPPIAIPPTAIRGEELEITISTVEVADGFQQRMHVYVPELLTMNAEFFYRPQSVEPIAVPEAVFTWEELQELIESVSGAALLSWERREAFPGDFEVVYDLEELNLVNYTLSAGSSFEAVPLESVLGNTYMILEPIYGVGDPEGTITHDGLRLAFSSHATSPMLRLDAVVFLEELARLFGGQGREISPGLMRANQERTIAFVPVRQSAVGEELSRFLMAQVMPDSGEIMVLEFWLWTIHADSLSEKRYAAVVELGQHVGIDFIAFLDGEYVFRGVDVETDSILPPNFWINLT